MFRSATATLRQPRILLIILGSLWIIAAVVALILQALPPAPVTITWKTESEIETAGYNVLRLSESNPEPVKLNNVLIPSQADPLAGGTYQFTDASVASAGTYEYVLEDVEFDGTVTRHSPITVTAEGRARWGVLFAVICASVGAGLFVYGARMER
jgi:hypothetical protein